MPSDECGSLKIRNFFSLIICTLYISMRCGIATADEYLQVAMHDRCNFDDAGCGLPLECCCKPSHGLVLNENGTPTNADSDFAPVNILCVNASKLPTIFPAGTLSLKFLSSTKKVMTEGNFNSSSLTNLTSIYIWKNTELTTIRDFTFADLQNLHTIILEDLPKLSIIKKYAFWNLESLRELRLKHTGLTTVPLFTGLSSLTAPIKITLDDTQITKLHPGAFESLPKQIKIIQFSWNMLFTTIEDYAFNGSYIAQLILSNNKHLSVLGRKAFYGIDELVKLNLADTSIKRLPSEDLKHLVQIDVRNTPYLYRFPELPSLRKAQLTYTYHCCALNAYGFGVIFDTASDNNKKKLVPCDGNKTQVSRESEYPMKGNDKAAEYEMSGGKYDDFSDVYDIEGFYSHPNFSIHYLGETETLIDKTETLGDEYDSFNDEDSTSVDDIFGWSDIRPVPTDATKTVQTMQVCYIDSQGNKVPAIFRTRVECTPKPDAFNPCENVLGTEVLPAISWTVSALAIIGNFFVILVLSVVTCDRACVRQHNLSVQKILVLNLAVADMCMGVYLLLISAMDARSSGEYYKYGVEWQTGAGCKVAGFLAIFSSQLSVYTLSIISLERWYAIHFAIRLDKRMTMSCARVCILFGWLLSGLMAVMPLVGVNNYEKTSICLPFDVSDVSGKAYVAVLLFISIGAFTIDVICYLWMYTTVRTANNTDGGRDGVFNIRKRRTSNSSSKTGYHGAIHPTADATVAKRMAVLVFTNFACFFPISFFALTAAAGKPLISISQSKILLVIFFPLNSCCNPFLYAIMTKSFRRDVLTWFTTRGYCLPLAAKLHGAQWRRNSADPGSGDRRETNVRRKFQQCVKYVSKRNGVHVVIVGEENCSSNSRKNDRDVTLSRGSDNVFKPEKHVSANKTKSSCPKNDVDNGSNSFSSYPPANVNHPSYKGVSQIFKFALMAKKNDNKSSSKKNSNEQTERPPSLLKWLQPSKKVAEANKTNNSDVSRDRASADDVSPLVEISDSRQFSLQAIESKPSSYPYERRMSRSRHSTTTIETRLTLNGVRGSIDHDNCTTDPPPIS